VSIVVVLTAWVASAQTSSVTGRVTNEQGGPVPNADVTLVPPPSAPMPGMRMPPAAPDRTARSGADGAFTLDQVPPGRYVLEVDAPGLERSSQEITVPTQQPFAIRLAAIEVPGGEATPAGAAAAGAPDTQALLDRIKLLEQRLSDVESGTVLSEPETRVKRIEVYVDPNGNQHDEPSPGTEKKVTYQRERVCRRQTINEKLEEAIAAAEERNVKIGVSAATVLQMSNRTQGDLTPGHAYQLASADLFFTAGLAQYTVFFADIVGLSGSPPDREIPAATLLNSFTARLVNQNELNLREAWVRTEVFSQKLGLVAGRLDLTNIFDHNAAANDESTQFVSDALVNNPALGLAVNGAGAAAVFDPKNGFNVKFGLQQSNPEATNLSQSIYSLAEVGYVARPPGLGEGGYRFWYRWNNTNEGSPLTGWGFSVDQKVTPIVTLFGRYGSSEGPDTSENDHFYSVGVGFQNGWVINPLDSWGIGYAQSDFVSGLHEKLAEGYYNLRLTERLRLSFHLQRVIDRGGEPSDFAYFLPGVRLHASF